MNTNQEAKVHMSNVSKLALMLSGVGKEVIHCQDQYHFTLRLGSHVILLNEVEIFDTDAMLYLPLSGWDPIGQRREIKKMVEDTQPLCSLAVQALNRDGCFMGKLYSFDGCLTEVSELEIDYDANSSKAAKVGIKMHISSKSY